MRELRLHLSPALRFLVLLLLIIVGGASASAQKHGKGAPTHKEVREFRIKYVAQEIGLRDDQRKQFIELYTKMLDERRNAFKEVRAIEKEMKKVAEPTEAQYKALSEARTKSQDANAEITKRYDTLFSKFLSQKQIVKMKEAEDRFRERMIQMRDNAK